MCIGILDSGVGGISTLKCLMNLLPNEDFVYVADKSCAPYGNKPEILIVERVYAICRYLSRIGAKAAVIACNTATSCAIDFMRTQGAMIYVGVEPPIKPACEELKWGRVLALTTPTTARGEKFIALSKQYGDKIVVAPQPELASLIEASVDRLGLLNNYIFELKKAHACQNIESVALGCTHYCFIASQIRQIFSAKVYDSNVGTALRLYTLLKQQNALNRKGGSVKFVTF